MKRHATTLLLFLFAVGLGVWLWFDRDKVTAGERQQRENNVFAAWRKEDVRRIEIAHPGETIVLERTGDAWRMLSPREERVDQAAAERLMTTLEFATMVRKVGDDTTGLGFESPRASGAIHMGPLVFVFELGAASPRPEGSSYLRIDRGTPFVISKELTEALLAPTDALRDRTVIPYLSLEMARFEVKHPSGGFALERSDERSFKIAGLSVLASRTTLDRVWGALAEMRAEAFPKDADADRLTANPRLTITIAPKLEGKPPGELVVGEACPGHPDDVVVLRKLPTRVAACAPKGAIDTLVAIVPAALVDQRPFSFRHDEIEELRLERIGAADADAGAPVALEIARRGTGFHQREPVDRELSAAEADAASELLVHVEQGVATEVRPGAGAPFTAIARARVRAGEHDEVVEVGPGPSYVLRRVRDDARLVVTATVARRLLPRATSFRPRTLASDERRVARVVLRCGTPQEIVDRGSGFRLVDPPGYETDGAIVQLVDGVFKGKVNAWVADADDGTFGLGAADPCRVVFSFEDGNAPLTVRFGAEGEGGYYGVIDGRPEVFVAPASLHALAERIYVSHGALRTEPARIEAVKVRAFGKAVPSSPAQREAVGGLFADRVVTLGRSDVGPVEIEIDVLTEGGPPKRITCGPLAGAWRRCAVSGVKAVFDVHPTHLSGLLGEADGGPTALTPGRTRP